MSRLLSIVLVFLTACADVSHYRIVECDSLGNVAVHDAHGKQLATWAVEPLEGTTGIKAGSCTPDGRLLIVRSFREGVGRVEVRDSSTGSIYHTVDGAFLAGTWFPDQSRVALLEKVAPDTYFLSQYNENLEPGLRVSLDLRRKAPILDQWKVSVNSSGTVVAISEYLDRGRGNALLVSLGTAVQEKYDLSWIHFIGENDAVCRDPVGHGNAIVQLQQNSVKFLARQQPGYPVASDPLDGVWMVRLSGPLWDPLRARIRFCQLGKTPYDVPRTFAGVLCVFRSHE